MVRSHIIELKVIFDPINEVEVRAYGFDGVFYLNKLWQQTKKVSYCTAI